MNPSLRLTRELIDQIVFGMENQDRDYVLDAHEGTVIPADQAHPDNDDDRYVALPEWRSVDGYNLMEQFVATLHNPIYRTRLRSILSSGRGVFRQFKDTVRERRDVERLWFAFKDQAMRELVVEWYNDLREREGLERLELEPAETETDQLVESDFVVRTARDDELEAVSALDRDAYDDMYPDTHPDIVAAYYADDRDRTPAPRDPASTILVAETQGGDFAGFLWAVARRSGDAAVAFVRQLYVLPEFRGFGLARELLHVFCHRAHEQCWSEVRLPLAGTSLDLETSFTSYGMEKQCVVLELDVDRWYRSEIG